MNRFYKTVLLFLCPLVYLSAQGEIFDVYVSDGGNFNNPPWQILKYDEETGTTSTFITDQLAWPQDIVFLEDQSVVLISNLNTGRITKYNSESGNYIENFATGISGPTRMKIGPDSLLYVLQWGGNGLVLRYELDGSFLGAFTSVGVPQSIGLDWDEEGNLYVSSYNGNIVRKFDPEGKDMGIFINSSLQGPTNIWFDEDGFLFANNWNGTAVKRFDQNGQYLNDFITGLANPEGIAIYPNGNMLIGNGGTQAVKMFDGNGQFIMDLIPSGTANLLLPNAVVLRAKELTSTSSVLIDDELISTNVNNRFYVSDEYPQEVQSVEVYNFKGEIVYQNTVSDSLLWDASNTANGQYVIKATLRSGNMASQKIVVMQ